MTTNVRFHLGMWRVRNERARGWSLGVGLRPAMAGEGTVGTQTSKPITFTKDIAPIFQEKCDECHRPGAMAPMSLESYQSARPWARSIKERVIKRQMPPWHINKHVGIQKFKNDASLSDEQIAMIVKWVDCGAPQGDPKDMPAAKVWPADDAWQLAQVFHRPPDLIIKSDDYTMPAVSQDNGGSLWSTSA